MFVSSSCQYAIRVLTYLVSQKSSDPVLERKIAESEDIPPKYLSQILYTLRNNGLVRTTAGRKGGYQLNRPADAITIKDVVSAVDGLLPLTEICVLGRDKCSDDNCCVLHDMWTDLRGKLLAAISIMTLEPSAQS